MKKFFNFWLPPILWMAIFFPVGNRVLASSRLYEVFMALLYTVFPRIQAETAGLCYIVFRKSLHFIEYGILAWLVYRASRAGRGPRWKGTRALQAGAFSIVYGFLDEFLQSFVPNRNGSPIDWAVDTGGVLAALFLVNRLSRRMPAALPSRPGAFWKALFLKRPLDIVLSGLGILLSSPLWLLISFLVWLQDRGPVFYAQERVGKAGRVFKALKFRSMVVDAEKGRGPVQAVEHDPRVTRIGRILRASAMDELPQLLSIFKGDMSFVGPRALRPNEKEVHGGPDARPIEEIPGYRERHVVRPGLTGLTQVYLPGETPRRKKFRYDLLYIRKRTFWLDLKLIFLSFWITFRGRWESRTDKV
jgi:lipopolysaccharide/colanic/teichoic acid biosynthesis glycosyltransferase/VanZ family protein